MPKQVISWDLLGYVAFLHKQNRIKTPDNFYESSGVFVAKHPQWGMQGPRLTFVGAPGFEPGASCSQSKRASRTALRPDLLYRSQGYLW